MGGRAYSPDFRLNLRFQIRLVLFLRYAITISSHRLKLWIRRVVVLFFLVMPSAPRLAPFLFVGEHLLVRKGKLPVRRLSCRIAGSTWAAILA